MNIILYTTGCPRCKVLAAKLDSKKIPYIVNNNVDDMIALGVSSAPILQVDDKVMTFTSAVKWVNDQEERV